MTFIFMINYSIDDIILMKSKNNLFQLNFNVGNINLVIYI